ncbi:MAG TPA: GDSL-type esterase/lipase family protein [Tepidisphaeraceae bacterium]|nr:GDSL-type esterase/lipase family protein [Tepidisphaeraceae bacterium]
MSYWSWVVAVAMVASAGWVGAAEPASTADPVWKTAYVKRTFMGNFQAPWADPKAGDGQGAHGAVRMRTPLAVGGARAKVFVQGSFEKRVEVVRMSLVRGADEMGKAAGDELPVTFGGQRGLVLEARANPRTSDVVVGPLTAGTWYVEDAYASATVPYAYEVDYGWWRTGGEGAPGTKTQVRLGVVRRVDVLTADRRPLVACFGDSITAGLGSTPNAGRRYTDVLAKLADRPVLNLGTNGDTMAANGALWNAVGGLAGVEVAVVLLGTNDVAVGKSMKSAEDYAKLAKGNVAELQRRKIKVVWGTVPPCGGFKAFDADPAREALRQAINGWIRSGSGADAVVDFDAALRDPAAPARMKVEYHNGDWIHPSDAGYQRMGEVAAEAVGKI